jgi:hypothetical protein
MPDAVRSKVTAKPPSKRGTITGGAKPTRSQLAAKSAGAEDWAMKQCVVYCADTQLLVKDAVHGTGKRRHRAGCLSMCLEMR